MAHRLAVPDAAQAALPAINSERLDQLSRHVDALEAGLRIIAFAAAEGGEPGSAYEAAALAQTRRREMHLVDMEASQ